MRAFFAAAIAAIEAVAAALITLLIAAAIAFAVWWLSFNLAAEPSDVLIAAAGAWLVAHFVPFAIEVPAEAMLQLGFAPEALAFTFSLAPLGLTLITVAIGARSGWRFGARGGAGGGGVLGGTFGFAAAVGIVASLVPGAQTSPWLAGVWGALVFGVPSGIGFLVRAARTRQAWWLATLAGTEQLLVRARLPRPSLALLRVGSTLRLATMLLAGYVGLAAIGLVITLVGRFAPITAASQALQLDGWGALILWVVQLLFLPVALVWSGAWLTGAGFAVGTGTSASPFGALLGPLPGLPLFAAIPDGWGSFGVLAPVFVVAVGITVGALFSSSTERRGSGELAVTAIVAAMLVGCVVALLNTLASGSLGPGRLETAGPEVWIGAGVAALELGGGALLGTLASRADLARRVSKISDLKRPELKLPNLSLSGLGGAVREERSVLRPEEDPESVSGARPEPAPAQDPSAERLAPVSQLVPRSFGAPSISRTAGTPDTAHTADTAAEQPTEPIGEQLTEPLDDAVLEQATLADPPRSAPVPSAPTRPAPTLFDQHDVAGRGDSDGPGNPGNPSLRGASETAHPRDLDPADPDPDALVEAYAWDSPADPIPAPETRTGWRWPRRKG